MADENPIQDKLDESEQTAKSDPAPETHEEGRHHKVPGDDLAHALAKVEGEDPDVGSTPNDHTAQPAPKTLKHPSSRRKKIVLVGSAAALVVVLAALFIVPVTRYAILGTFVRQTMPFLVVDSKTGRPVSGVMVSVAGQSATSDAQGKLALKSIPVGDKSVTATKKYYQSLHSSLLLPLGGRSGSYRLSLVATGRQVPIKIINKISGSPISKATITFDGSASTTDAQGQTTMVLPADKPSVSAAITANGYNKAAVTVQVTEQADPKNTFAVVPSGRVYFLSDRSGTIDVRSSALDGSDVQTVLKGTGKEDQTSTVLLASRDWKYLALLATRDSDQPKLYLISTATGKLTVMDEGDASFSPVGWYDNNFVYTLTRNNVNDWTPKRYALKSFDAVTGNLRTLDESNAVGSNQNDAAYETIGNVNLLNEQIVYTKSWNYNQLVSIPGSRALTINVVSPDGSGKKALQSFDDSDNSAFVYGALLVKPQALYFYLRIKNQDQFWQYVDGKMSQSQNLSSSDFYKSSATYLVSPSGNYTFWSEPQDGKTALFVGDGSGNNGKQVGAAGDYQTYGWLTDSYVLVSKNNSELYIIARDGSGTPLKVTDYHKPAYSLPGYGYGYGGL